MDDSVFLKDVGSVYCADKLVTAKVKSMKLHHFEKGQGSRCVISVLKITEMIEELCPQVTVQSVGETDVVAEWVQVSIHKKAKEFWKILLVSVISFFGTAFTIMAYHNDIGIANVFSQIHRIVMGTEQALGFWRQRVFLLFLLPWELSRGLPEKRIQQGMCSSMRIW